MECETTLVTIPLTDFQVEYFRCARTQIKTPSKRRSTPEMKSRLPRIKNCSLFILEKRLHVDYFWQVSFDYLSSIMFGGL